MSARAVQAMRDALSDLAAAFEKAHTPTDDERKALVAVIADARSGDDFDLGEFIGDRPLADRILAAGFRRSEVVPEPSADYEAGYAEGFHHGLSSPRGAAEDDREPQSEPSAEVPEPSADCEYIDREVGATCQNFYDTPCETGDCGASYCWTCNACGACKANAAEPQGEPSEAQVEDAWWKAQAAGQLPRTPGRSNRQAFDVGYRAALRAAFDA